MSRNYRQMWEETASIPNENYKSDERKKYLGKVIINTGENIETGKSFYTITSRDDLFENEAHKSHLSDEVYTVLSALFKKYSVSHESKILVVALGNEKITADSLGCRVADKLVITSHIFENIGIRSRYGNLCAIKSSVSGVTGIESFELISSAVKAVKPNIVIAVDTLSCARSERLSCTIQLTDNGIEPGGGVNNPKKKLTIESLKLPVIAIGVPFVIYTKTILAEHGVKECNSSVSDLIVTAKEIDFLINDYSDVIATAINKVVHNK